MDKKCPRCGETKRVQKFKTDKRRDDGRSYACLDCYTNNKVGKGWCTEEGRKIHQKKMTGRKYDIEHRLAISSGLKKRVLMEREAGKLNTIPHKNQERCHLDYKIWREIIFYTKGKKCQECKTDKQLEIHHIKGYHEHPELKYNIDNGMVLCKSCHMKKHQTWKLKKSNEHKLEKGQIP